MRHIVRLPLSQGSLRFLKEERADLVAKKRSTKTQLKKARALWPQQRNRAFRELKATLAKMSSGLKRCMYCEDSSGSGIDHFWPMSSYPLKAFEWTNLLLSCSTCNQSKSARFRLDASGRPLLLNPTEDDPALHVQLTPRTGKFTDLTERGRESLETYGLNRPELAKGRSNAWAAIQSLLIDYAGQRQRGDHATAQALEAVIRQAQFSCVLAYLLAVAQSPGASLLRPACLAAIKARAEVMTWV
jgi:uncharacterized protein (TIGR02646 family)